MLKFTAEELRVIGCLIEKSLTTPDQYPLSINALTNACNQKSNREPVLTLSEIEVQNCVDSLMERRVIMAQSGASSRVSKYKHRFCNTEFSDLQLTAQELGIICVLFLRGPQTPGELRTRTGRLCQFVDVHETENVLEKMAQDENTPLVVKLERLPGKRESRYAHCFGDEVLETQTVEAETPLVVIDAPNRISELEDKMEMMQMEIDELREKLATLIDE
jgi:uncharacterized protein YceH (UPF0502 family)